MAYSVTIHEVAIYYQASRLVGLAPDDPVTAETYLYRDMRGKVCVTWKRDRSAQPVDERECIGYAYALGVGTYPRGQWA